MATLGIVSWRRIMRFFSARLISASYEIRCGFSRSQECLLSSSVDLKETATENPGRGLLQRWKELPPVPRESAVTALEEIEGIENGSVEGRMKHQTALRWVAKCCPSLPHSLINKLFRQRQIRMRLPGDNVTDDISESSNARLIRVGAKESLKEGSVLFIPSAVSQEPNETGLMKNHQEVTPEDIKWLRSLVLHKDEEVIVINKPIGLAVQGGSKVIRSLDSLMGQALSYDSSEGPRLVHRLDKDTSGALVIGRTHQSTVFLHALLRDKSAQDSQAIKSKTKSIERTYWALVMGIPGAKEGRISAPLAKVVTDGGKLEKMRVVQESHPGAQEAITYYKVLGPSIFGCSWLELRPLTGRKHQIRVHCAEVLGMPILGDYKYGWTAHRVWPPEGKIENSPPPSGVLESGLKGHIFSSKPFLHLHCRQLSLPNVATLFRKQLLQKPSSWIPIADMEKKNSGFSSGNTLNITASLPLHMVGSWNLRPVRGIDISENRLA